MVDKIDLETGIAEAEMNKYRIPLVVWKSTATLGSPGVMPDVEEAALPSS